MFSARIRENVSCLFSPSEKDVFGNLSKLFFPPFFPAHGRHQSRIFPLRNFGHCSSDLSPASGSSPSQQVSPGQSFTEGLFSCRTCGAQQFHLPPPGYKIQSPIHGCICRHGIDDGAGISQALGSIQGCWFPPQLYLTTLQSAGDEPLPKAPGVWLCSPGFPALPGQQETLWEAAELGADKWQERDQPDSSQTLLSPSFPAHGRLQSGICFSLAFWEL